MPARQPWSEDLSESVNLVKAFASPIRLRMLCLLSKGEICHCHLSRALQIPENIVDNHLRWLRNKKIVLCTRTKYFMFHSLAKLQNPLQARLMDAIVAASAGSAVLEEDYARLKRISRDPAAGGACRSDLYDDARQED